MNINLLPVVPKTRRFKFPIFLLVALVVLGASGLVALDVYEKLGKYNDEKAAYELVAADLERAEARLAASRAESKVFLDYNREFNEIQKGYYDVTKIFDAVAGLLPSQGYVNSLQLSEDGNMQLALEFPKILQVSQLIQVFTDTAWVDDVQAVASTAGDGAAELHLNMQIDLDKLLEGGETDE